MDESKIHCLFIKKYPLHIIGQIQTSQKGEKSTMINLTFKQHHKLGVIGLAFPPLHQWCSLFSSW
jgi:hypothetical protein